MLVVVGILLTAISQADAAVLNAQSVSLADVRAAVALATDGDTVIIPAGTASWTNALNYSVAITLQGSGVGVTIIKDDAPGAENNNSGCINVTTTAGKPYRITGIEFQPGVRTQELSKGCVALRGFSHSVRVDHCKITANTNRCLTVWDWVLGVCDHVDFYANNEVVHVAHGSWGNSDGTGDGSWTSDSTLGTADAFYIEDFTVTSSVPGLDIGVCDSEFGARWVVRHGAVTGGQIGSHGTEGGVDRSTRQFEVYDVAFITTNINPNAIHCRGGSGVYFNNTAIGYGNFATLNCYRGAQTYPIWGVASGFNPWDSNQSGGPFWSGTYFGPNGAVTMTDTSQTWSTNELLGYSLTNVTSGRSSSIMSHNAHTITQWHEASQDGMMTFHNGDAYEIWKVNAALDMPGMGKGDAMNRSTPAWPNEIIEGIYAWDNTLDGSTSAALMVSRKYPFIREGIHYFNQTQKPGYTPFTYPHPLTRPAPPTNLRVIAGP
jgi:hypothetical protein